MKPAPAKMQLASAGILPEANRIQKSFAGGAALSFGRGFNAVGLENVADRLSGDVVAEVGETLPTYLPTLRRRNAAPVSFSRWFGLEMILDLQVAHLWR